MDLHETWKKLEHDRLEKPADWKPHEHPENCRSKHPALKLKKSLETTLGFSVVFLTLFIVLIFLFDHWLVKLFIGAVGGAYVFFSWYNYITLKELKLQLKQAFDTSLKTSLEQIHRIVFQSIRFQEKAALFIYPFSVIAGYTMGLSQHDNFEQDIQETSVLIALVIAIVILTPACYYLARWMYKVSYDKYLDQLKKLIHEMDSP
ncbi:MAG: hypothetical protein QY309_16275 [Cyclobacteriaceae bacterium]|nr:MAG: hypothetical protein QY309_16275 [Cyclobacteriaceae bacterium]